jgi:allophanate hydrolase
VGVPAEPIFFDRMADGAAYRAAFTAAVAALRAQGHEPVPIDFGPLHAVAALLYDGPWVAERHAVVQDLLAREPEALDTTVRRVIEAAHRHSATDTFRNLYRLRDAQRDTASIWKGLDALMVPTAPGHPTFAEVDADPLGTNSMLGTYTNFVNLLGWCALALPAAPGAASASTTMAGGQDAKAGPTHAALPVGVTFIAPGGHDAALAHFGTGWQQALDLPLAPTATQVPLHLRDLPPPGAAVLPQPATEPVLPIAVVGAHLSGLPLNAQLTERGATLIAATTTAPHYRLHALPGTTPPKPGLVRSATEGHAIALEVWALPQREVGSFLALIPPPLGLGSIELADGRWVHGFLCEAHALQGAPDVSHFGGWRAYVASLSATAAAPGPALASPSAGTAHA